MDNINTLSTFVSVVPSNPWSMDKVKEALEKLRGLKEAGETAAVPDLIVCSNETKKHIQKIFHPNAPASFQEILRKWKWITCIKVLSFEDPLAAKGVAILQACAGKKILFLEQPEGGDFQATFYHPKEGVQYDPLLPMSTTPPLPSSEF